MLWEKDRQRSVSWKLFIFSYIWAMQKTWSLYDSRNENKKKLAHRHVHKIVHVGQIWMYKVWVNLGTEISKDAPYMRPCIILSQKLWWDLVFTIPLTSKFSRQEYAKPLIDSYIYGLLEDSRYLLNQVRTISIKRLVFKCNDKKDEDGIHIRSLSQEKVDGIYTEIFAFLTKKTTDAQGDQSTVDEMSE
jgi:mRNA-degrading endonuclease toxin of MazEF toxin-antitoxin module